MDVNIANINCCDIQNEQREVEYDMLPLFEKGVSDRLTKCQKSLVNNCELRQKWQTYKENFSTRVISPFQFPDVRDYHFYNYYNRLIPQISLKYRKEFRMKLRPGPGVDFRGQMPIPNELFPKSTGSQKIKPPRAVKKNNKKDKNKN